MPSLKMTLNKIIIRPLSQTISMTISRRASSRAHRIRRRFWVKYHCNKLKKKKIALILMVSERLKILASSSMMKILIAFNKMWKTIPWRTLKDNGSFSSWIQNLTNHLKIKKVKGLMDKRNMGRDWWRIYLKRMVKSNLLKLRKLWWMPKW